MWGAVRVTRRGSCLVGCGLRRLVLAGVRLWGCPLVAPVPWCADVPWWPRSESRLEVGLALTRCGRVKRRRFLRCGAGPSTGVYPGTCPRNVSFPTCCGPCPFPLSVLVVPRWFLAPVMCCPRCPCFRGCVPFTLRLASPLCHGPSLCPGPFQCPGGGVMEGPGGRRWPVPGSGQSGATGGGFRGCRGG